MDYSLSSLTDVARQYIKDQILSGTLKCGDKVIETEVSQALQISRAPVREAFRSLDEQGILTHSPRRGHVVWEIPRDELFEIFQIRISLELHVLRLLITHQLLTPVDFNRLEQFIHQMETGDATPQTDSERVFLLNSLDIAFHKYLWDASQNKRHAKMLESLFYQLLIAMNVNVDSLGSYKEKAEEHRIMLRSLKSGDTNKLCKDFKAHLQKYINAAMGSLSRAETRTLNALYD